METEATGKKAAEGEAGDLTFRALPRIGMKGHPTLSEKWLQKQIAKDPSILGLGKLDVKDVERQQPGAGRLDMLLVDADGQTRYEVELQLGATDPSHIIRVLEYWDNERRRFPQYDHIAVLAAEDITSRFFNVISLFNHSIPIIAIQFSAHQISDIEVTLLFVTVLDLTQLGTEEEDEKEVTDRQYWTRNSTPKMLSLADRVHDFIKETDPGIELGYRKRYIGLVRDKAANNYVRMIPKKKQVNLDFPRISQSDDVTNLIADSGISMLEPNRWSHYRLIIQQTDFSRHSELLKTLIKRSQES